jgi:hypothetical protein
MSMVLMFCFGKGARPKKTESLGNVGTFTVPAGVTQIKVVGTGGWGSDGAPYYRSRYDYSLFVYRYYYNPDWSVHAREMLSFSSGSYYDGDPKPYSETCYDQTLTGNETYPYAETCDEASETGPYQEIAGYEDDTQGATSYFGTAYFDGSFGNNPPTEYTSYLNVTPGQQINYYHPNDGYLTITY